MTVAELIEKLQGFPQDMPVLIDIYDKGETLQDADDPQVIWFTRDRRIGPGYADWSYDDTAGMIPGLRLE